MAPSAKKKTTKASRDRARLKASRDRARLKELELGEQILTGENRGLRTQVNDLVIVNTDLEERVRELSDAKADLKAGLHACQLQLEERDRTIITQAEQWRDQELELKRLRKLIGSISKAGELTAERYDKAQTESEARGDDILMLVRLLSTRTSGRNGDSVPEPDELESVLERVMGDLSDMPSW